MEPIGLNDLFTCVNTVLCILLILLRLFYYRKNPKIDTLIKALDDYVKAVVQPDPGLPPISNVYNNNEHKS